MRLGKVSFLILVGIIVGGAVYGAGMIRRGFSTRAEPSRLESVVARAMRNLSIPKAEREQANPWAGSAAPEIVASGRAHWADHCAICHANDGSGNTVIGRNLYPKAPDMRLPATQNLTDGELYYIIRNGVRLTGMPAWGNPAQAQDDESWHLVQFIRHLPKVTPEELMEMKKLNPKTEAERAEEREIEEFLNGGEPSQNPAGEPHHP